MGQLHFVLMAYHFPPTTEVGGIRAAKVAKALLGAGHRVTVIRAPGSDESRGTPMEPHPNLQIRTVVPGPAPRELYAQLKSKLGFGPKPAEPGAAPEASFDTWQAPRRIGLFKRFAYSIMWLPDDHQGFILVASRTAVDLIRADPAAVLYSTSPPASAPIAAWLTTRRTGVRWIAEFRDPWTDNPGRPWYARTKVADWLESWLEHQCLKRAQLVISVTDAIDRVMKAKVSPSAAHKFVVVLNGIDRLADRPAPRNGGEPYRIVHLGTLYLGRDPRPFLNGLAAVVRRKGLGERDVAVELIGRCDYFDGQPVQRIAEELGLGSIVRVESWVPRDEAERRTRAADLLVVFAEGQPLQVPNKLYEYLGSRRPLLAFADPTGETATMVRRLGGHQVVSGADQRGVEAAIDTAIFSSPSSTDSDALLEEWSTERQMGKLVAAVEAKFGGGKPN